MSDSMVSTLILMLLILMTMQSLFSSSAVVDRSNTTSKLSLPLTIKEEAFIARWMIHHYRIGVLKDSRGVVTYALMIILSQH